MWGKRGGRCEHSAIFVQLTCENGTAPQITTVWSKYGTYVVTFRARAARQLRAAAPPSASEPRPTFTPGVFQHHHLFATRAEQRLHAVTWVFGLEPKVLVASAQ